ncbi:MAG: hypothetical protein IT288_02625 [Bdellovibrionales bacterium]|nr:hypothetical protein [Bdellovibrionales bacterium]
MKKLILPLLLPLAIVGCSGGTGQDPLQNQPDNVRKGVPPGEKPKEDRNPVPREAMRLEVEPEVVYFVEGKEGSFTIKTDVLGYDKEEYTVEIKNLPEGASFDSATGKVTWKPLTDMVIGDDYMETYNLIIQMSTLKKPVMSLVRRVPIFVQRDSPRPEIVKVHMPNEVQEGSEVEFTVQVRDLDSTDGSLFRFRTPHITVVQTDDTYRDGASLVSLVPSTSDNPNPRRLDPSDPTYDPNLWIYKMRVNARNRELTSSRDNFKFGLIATSRFGLPSAEGGVPSQPKGLSIAVITKVPRPLTTWGEDVIEFKTGVAAVYTWDIYSPMGALNFRSSPEGDGDLDAPTIAIKCNADMPGPAECKCTKAASQSWRYNCRMTWTPGAIDPDKEKYPIAFRAVNRNRFRNSDAEPAEFLKYVKIVQ